MKRAILIEETGEELELSIFITPNIPKTLFHVGQLSDSTWRLSVSKSFISDFSKVKSLKIVDKVLTVEGIDETIFLAKVAVIGGDSKVLELIKDGKGNIQLLFTKSLFPEFKGSMTFKIIRED